METYHDNKVESDDEDQKFIPNKSHMKGNFHGENHNLEQSLIDKKNN